MATRPRGVLLNADSILLANGTRIPTFYGCDLDHLELDGVRPGDIVSFAYVSGTKHAQSIRKVTRPTPKELALQQSSRTAKNDDDDDDDDA